MPTLAARFGLCRVAFVNSAFILRDDQPTMLEIRTSARTAYDDVFTKDAIATLEAVAPLDADRKAVMAARLARRARRAQNHERIAFLEPGKPHRTHEHHGAGGPRRAVRGQ